MARTKTQKKEIIEKIGKIVDSAKSLVFVNIHGLKVSNATILRRKLKSEGVGFFVAKKTLMWNALGIKNYEGTLPTLDGEIALAYGADPMASSREVYAFQKELKDQISIQGGIFENKYMSKEEMVNIATIPPLEVLRGMFVRLVASPMQGLVVALDQINKK